jgi:peptide deformylase
VSTLPIRTYGDLVLTAVTSEIELVDEKIVALAYSMIETMNEAPGVGLAANQIGVQKRLFVYDKGDGPHVVVNPVIVETSGEWLYEEGCLSVPGLSWEISRPNAVHLKGYDLDGNELDHLNGMLLIDRLDDDQRRDAKIALRERRLGVSRNDHDGLRQLLGE